MKKYITLALCSLLAIGMHANKRVDTSEKNWSYGHMHQWRAHTAVGITSQAVVTTHYVYGVANNSLYSVDKQSEEISYHNRLTGLSGAVISQMEYNPSVDAILMTYQNGQLDIIDTRDDIHNIPDLYLKQMNYSKVVNHIYMHGDKAYLSMSFGIIVLDMKKREIKDTYFLGNKNEEINVQAITIIGDTLYALSSKALYTASLQSNLMDFAHWTTQSLPGGKNIKDFISYDQQLYLVSDASLWVRNSYHWQDCKIPFAVAGICPTDDHLFILPTDRNGLAIMDTDYSLVLEEYGTIYDVVQDHDSYWISSSLYGLFDLKNQRYYTPRGPIENTAYRMRFFGDRLYVVPGGRWATQNKHTGCIMYLENDRWTNISSYMLGEALGFRPLDLMNVAQDPKDPNHYFVTSYGCGMLEMYGSEVLKHHRPDNSPLCSAVPDKPEQYTRTDCAIYDENGYLWVLNTDKAIGLKNIHVISPDQKQWESFNLTHNGQQLVFNTPGEIVIDNRNPNWKWIPLCRDNTGIILLDDQGTPLNPNDDRMAYRTQWVDQDGKQIRPHEIHSMAQDLDGTLWIGTDEGIFLIPSTIDFASSDRCERVIIGRNDGTQLGDYLLENEKIQSIVVDGANRKWIGTATSGVFLLSEDGQETIEHFTTENSPLLSNTILSIAIQKSTGEVFIGTGDGLMSYMSDAVPAEEDFSQIYAYPNPVHPNYRGYVVIKGLMADTEVRIVDASGNLLKTLEGLGGEVVWDMTNAMGARVASGVYTAICNTKDGSAYGTTKILVIN